MVHSWINNSYQQYSHDFCESSSTFVYIFNDRVDSLAKLKFLIEELPTLEHMKLCRPDLYKDWNCVMCHNDKENFNHVWTCDQHLSHIQQIIYNQKKALIQLVKEYTKGNKLFSFADL